MKKQRSTTPVSLSFGTRIVLILSVIVVAFAVPIQLSKNASADKYDDQMNALRKNVDQYQTQVNALREQTASLQNALDIINAEKAQIQAQIDVNQAQSDQLSTQIVETEKKIAANKDALGETIADLYVDDKITPLEMLASSKNVADYVDKQSYRSSVRDTLTTTIATIKTLKKELDEKKVAVDKILGDQKVQRDSLAAKEAEQGNLIAQTQGQEAAYQGMISNTKAQLEQVAAQQRAAIAALTNNGQNTAGTAGSFQFRNYSGNQGACGGGYPGRWCNAGLDAYVDDWALYSRECVSYAAWAAQNRFGKYVASFAGQGHAYQWPSTVLRMGANVDSTPTVGSVAISPRQAFTPYGHAMVVEEVYGDGWVRVSQYNFAGTGEYSTMDLKVSSAVYVHFRDR